MIYLFKFFKTNHKLRYALISGGMLGLASLTRMNPLFILPLVLAVILFAERKHFRKAALGALVFMIGFSMVFIPWTISAKDSDGNNFYMVKIQQVLNYRYTPLTNSDNDLIPDQSDPTIVPTSQPTKAISGSLGSNVIIRKVNNPRAKSGIEGIAAHFLNNEFQSIAKLPINFQVLPIQAISDQPLWKDVNQAPFWKIPFTFENLVVLLMNLLVILTGIVFAIRVFGVSGAVPLIIQVGYHIGNGFAMTSGDRYLQPVDWVMFLYYVFGFYAILLTVFNREVLPLKRFTTIEKENITEEIRSAKGRRKKEAFILAGIVLVVAFAGLILPIANITRKSIAAMSEAQKIELAASAIAQNSNIPESAVASLLADPKSIIVEGIAYHSRNYESPIVYPNRQVFETTVLGDDNVLRQQSSFH